MIQSKKWVLRYQIYSHDEYALACFASSIISGVTYLKYTCISDIKGITGRRSHQKKKQKREGYIKKNLEEKKSTIFTSTLSTLTTLDDFHLDQERFTLE